jgi:CHAT domain-containing protein
LTLAHLACEAIYERDFPDGSRLLVSDEFPVSLQDMAIHDIFIHSHPLVILNACRTGNINPRHTAHFAGAFLRYGARGVVATECMVPDDFAADFAEQLYRHLLRGESLGESMLAARRFFLGQGNPSGLLYSMYAAPSIRLVRQPPPAGGPGP